MNLAKEFNLETFSSPTITTTTSLNGNNYSGIDSDSSSVIEITDDEEDGESEIYNSFYYQKNYYASSPSVVSSEDEDEDSSESDNGTQTSDSEDDCSSSSDHHHHHDELIPGKCLLCENLENISGEELEDRCQISTSDTWCKCGKCKIVSYHMKKYDRICCRELKNIVSFLKDEDIDEGACITNHPKFQAQVLEYGALYGKHRHHHQHLNDENSSQENTMKSNSKYRRRNSDSKSKERAYSASCSFVHWIWNQLGYGNNNDNHNEIGQIIPPACVIAKIREVHMKNAPFWYYRNFISNRQICEYGKHCVGAANDTYCSSSKKKC